MSSAEYDNQTVASCLHVSKWLVGIFHRANARDRDGGGAGIEVCTAEWRAAPK